MMAPDAVQQGVLDAIEAAGLGNLPLRDARRLADALYERFPTMGKATGSRAHWQRWAPEDEARLVHLFTTGVPERQIAAELGRSLGAIKGAVSRLKLTRTPPKYAADPTNP